MKIIAILAAIFATCHSSTAFTLTCEFQLLSYIVVDEVYGCITNQDFFESNQTVSSVVGTHLDGHSHENVTSISIDGRNALTFIPRGFAAFFPNFDVLYVQSASISALNGDELNDIPKLRWLGIVTSNIQTISSHLFDQTPNLIFASFRGNRLLRVGLNLFSNISVDQLAELWFDRNVCVDRRATNTVEVEALVDDLPRLCPYEDEQPITSTTTETTSPGDGGCWLGSIEETVCKLKETVGELESDVEDFGTEIREMVSRAEFEAMEAKLRWLEEELLRISANPCTC